MRIWSIRGGLKGGWGKARDSLKKIYFRYTALVRIRLAPREGHARTITIYQCTRVHPRSLLLLLFVRGGSKVLFYIIIFTFFFFFFFLLDLFIPFLFLHHLTRESTRLRVYAPTSNYKERIIMVCPRGASRFLLCFTFIG